MTTTATKTESISLGNGIDMVFCRIRAGTFRMGTRGRYTEEEPVHDVVISQPYWLGLFPVTQQQFEQWTQSEAYAAWHAAHGSGDMHANRFSGRPEHPTEQVTWFEACGFCDWLNANVKGRLPAAGLIACLPTEAQWEYACRAGTETDYHSGDGVAALAEAGWYEGNAGETTHPIGGKVENNWGLYDMHGNVAEWCVDYYDAAAYGKRRNCAVDPVAANVCDIEEAPDAKVFRSWVSALQGVLKGDADDGQHRPRLKHLRACIKDSPDVQKNDWLAAASALDSWLTARRLTDNETETLQALIHFFVDKWLGGARRRVIRGGAWDGAACDCRSADRSWNRPGNRFRFVGFRVCLVPGPDDSRKTAEAAASRGDGTPKAVTSRRAGGTGATGVDLAGASFPRRPGAFPPK